MSPPAVPVPRLALEPVTWTSPLSATAVVTVALPADAVTVASPLVAVIEVTVTPPWSAVMLALRGATTVPTVTPLVESVSWMVRSRPMVKPLRAALEKLWPVAE